MDSTALQELVKTVSEKELREDENTRVQALQEFRDWIEKNPDISNCRTDDVFLLGFLRMKKFSVPMAEHTLIRFLKYREDFPHLTRNLDILDPALNSIVTNGYMFPSPYCDDNGRKVIIIICSKNDPYKVKYQDLSRVDNLTFLTLAENEATQVMGCSLLVDVSNIVFAHATLWPAREFADALSSVQQSFPLRHKEIHILNLPPIAKVFFDVVKSASSEKMRRRFKLHSSLEEVHQYINPKCLPKEYGGTMTASEMIGVWKEKLLANRENLISLDTTKLIQTEDKDCMQVGSFKKLLVD